MNIPDEYKKLECWFKVSVQPEGKTAREFIRGRWFERGLIFGDPFPASRCDRSVIVGTSDPGPIAGAVRIVCPVLGDARFVQMIAGYHMRSASVADLFAQYPGPYDLITAIDSGRDRSVFWSECVLSALPRLYVIGEDGHNEDVIKRADEMGYKVMVCEDAVVMGRQLW
jgi:hypothetical protein